VKAFVGILTCFKLCAELCCAWGEMIATGCRA